MNVFSSLNNKLGFTFSFRRLRKAILLVILFTIIGIGVALVYNINSSESGLRRIYEKEISSLMDIGDNNVIKVSKEDINEDGVPDFVFAMGVKKSSGTNSLNSTVEMYENVEFVILDGKTKEAITYNTNTNFKPDLSLNIAEDSTGKYYLIYDSIGNIKLFTVDSSNNIIDITSNTVNGPFLGYTIYTSKEENEKLLDVNIDNYNKPYLNEYTDTKCLDFTESTIDLSCYRETYLRDKISCCEVKDVDGDGKLDFVTTQYILYSMTDNSTIGKVETVFNIVDNKLTYKSVEIKL